MSTDFHLRHRNSERPSRETGEPAPSSIPSSWFRHLVEQSLVGIYLVQEGRFTYVNPRFSEIFGYSPEEIVRDRTVADLVAPEDRRRVQENIRRRVAGEVEDMHYQFRAVRRDGERLDVEVHGARVEMEGTPAILGTLLDVTERRRRQEELRVQKAHLQQLFEEARAAVEEREEVLAVVSHDLRNPLNAIGMGVDLVLATNPEGEMQNRGALETVKRVTRQMSLLIQDLLDVTSMEAGHLTVEPTRQEVAPLLDAMREMLLPLVEAKSLELEVETDGLIPAVRADHDRVLQVFSNLLGNAVKFTPAGGRVCVRARADADEVVFSVSDTGPGIPPDQVPFLFDRFWQGRRGDRGGAGLGLRITRGVVEAHGGRIWVESEVGNGSVFYFTVPTADPG